jgi:hypothetical protein
MWRKATCYKSATFAAFVVASSLTLLTGAQADPITFQYPNGAGYGLSILSSGQGPDNGQFSELNIANGPPPNFIVTATAMFDGNSGRLSIPSSNIPSFCTVAPGGCVSVGGHVGNTYTAISPNTSTLQLTFGSNVLTGTMTITALEDMVPRPGVGFGTGVNVHSNVGKQPSIF